MLELECLQIFLIIDLDLTTARLLFEIEALLQGLFAI